MSRTVGVRVASGVIGASLGLFAVTAVHALAYAPQQVALGLAPRMRPSASDAAQEPVRIEITSVGVDARIEALGLTPAGNMAAPALFSDAGWYRYGPAPGQPGSVVIAGHLDNGLGFNGVFKHLDALHPGDRIILTSADGAEHAYAVRGMHEYSYTEVPDALVFATSGPPRLVLITCAGSLLYLKRTYTRRLVVIAQPIAPQFSPL